MKYVISRFVGDFSVIWAAKEFDKPLFGDKVLLIYDKALQHLDPAPSGNSRGAIAGKFRNIFYVQQTGLTFQQLGIEVRQNSQAGLW